MNTKIQKILIVMSLGLMVFTAYGLHRLGDGRRLGEPGLKTAAIEGEIKREILLPDQVLDYQCEIIHAEQGVIDALPPDTSIAQRRYTRNGEVIQVNAVMMGTDRTSIHKPQYCIQGAGWTIQSEERIQVQIPKPEPYLLDVIKMVGTREIEHEGVLHELSAVLLYWFVEDDMMTPEHWERMWAMANNLIRTGELQRWAFVNCLGYCYRGQEDQMLETLKLFLAEAVPQFQLTHGQTQPPMP